MMLDFAASWVFFLLPLPLAYYFLIPPAQRQETALRVPFFQRISQQSSSESLSSDNKKLSLILLCLIWLCLIIAAAQPRWLGKPISMTETGRDIMLAVDLSGSMQREDMQIQGQLSNRLIAVKAVVSDFIQRRQGDRLGLIVFGTQAYIQSPLTFDRNTVSQLLIESQIGFAGENTAIGDAIGLATKRLRKRPGNEYVLILLTDGANTAGEVTPLAAAEIAAKSNIKIYTIGIGAEQLQTQSMFGLSRRTINPSADLDEDTLTKIAELTGGRYFRARNPKELLEIYDMLDKLEPIEDEEKTYRPKKSLFYWPLTIAFMLSLLLTLSKQPQFAKALAFFRLPQTKLNSNDKTS